MAQAEKLSALRERIDSIDNDIIKLLNQRMEVSSEIADCKRECGIPVTDAEREQRVLLSVAERSGSDTADYNRSVFQTIMAASRSYQSAKLYPEGELKAKIEDAVKNTPPLFPESAVVACQGRHGAYSQLAANKLFASPNIMYFDTFENVFKAIENGLCRYGVLPLENNTAGSVNKIYDLMLDHNFSIVRSVRIKVDHSLLAKPGTKMSDIKEIFSHEQAISQCSDFLSSLNGVKVTAYSNTAEAASMVASSERRDVAALSSRFCAETYGLASLADSVQNKGNNFTRFICISKNTEVYPGADRTSIMMVVSHKPGSLYHILSRFYALGINLVKLESRPLPDRDFEFMFYFDINASVYSPKFAELMCQLERDGEDFRYLGSYLEIV
jgi:chorismate mutase/prephenate dehydratase